VLFVQLVLRRKAGVYKANGDREAEVAQLNEILSLAHDSQPCWLELAERYVEMHL